MSFSLMRYDSFGHFDMKSFCSWSVLGLEKAVAFLKFASCEYLNETFRTVGVPDVSRPA